MTNGRRHNLKTLNYVVHKLISFRLLAQPPLLPLYKCPTPAELITPSLCDKEAFVISRILGLTPMKRCFLFYGVHTCVAVIIRSILIFKLHKIIIVSQVMTLG